MALAHVNGSLLLWRKKNIILWEYVFQKSDPPEAAPLLAPGLEDIKKFGKSFQYFLGDVIFQKSDPPEATPLLAPCLKIAKTN